MSSRFKRCVPSGAPSSHCLRNEPWKRWRVAVAWIILPAGLEPMVARVLITLVELYRRLLSPFLGNVCRFEPSCSRYAHICLEEHGAVRGSLLSLVRLCKCHPFHQGGYDPPPGRALSSSSHSSEERATPPRLFAHRRDENCERGAG